MFVIDLLVYNGLLYFQDWSYLVHWAGWPLSASSWEPEQNLTRDVVESYDYPTGITKERIDFGHETLLLGLQNYIRGQTAQNYPFDAFINFNGFRKLFETATPSPAAVRGYKAYQCSDFDGADLPVWWDRIVEYKAYQRSDFDGADLSMWWDRIVNKDWYGRWFVFPLLMRQILSRSPVTNTVDEHSGLQELPRTPVEKILVRCTMDAVP